MNNTEKNTEQESKTCKKCQGTTWVFNEFGEAIACECRNEEINKSKLKFLNMPSKYQKNTINNLDHNLYESKFNQKTVKDIKKWAERYLNKISKVDKGLYIYSETKGSGKTHLATAIGNALVNYFEIQTKFSTTIAILDAIKATYNNDSLTTTKKLLYDIQTVEVLILDDIGVERPTAHTEEVLYSIINERISNDKITIYTSNQKKEDLKLGDRIVNRIGGSTFPIKMPEESIRTKLAPKQGINELNKYLDNIK